MPTPTLHREGTADRNRLARPLVRWGLIVGCLLFFGGLGAMALMTWNRGRILQARIDAIHAFDGGVIICYSDSRYTHPSPTFRERERTAPGEGWIDEPTSAYTIRSPHGMSVRAIGDRPPRGVRWLVPIFGECSFTHVTEVSIRGSQFTDEHISLVLAFPELRSLDLYGTSVTDEGVRKLTALKRLTWLDVGGRPLSAETLRSLANCKELRHLHITETGVDAVTISYLWRALPDCDFFYE